MRWEALFLFGLLGTLACDGGSGSSHAGGGGGGLAGGAGGAMSVGGGSAGGSAAGGSAAGGGAAGGSAAGGSAAGGGAAGGSAAGGSAAGGSAAGGGAAGGGTSAVIPMPDATNRPVYDPATRLLTWSGPPGGGPSNGTYMQQTRLLTTQTGDMSSTGNGQVIEGLNIVGTLTIAHSNVTVRQCRITYPTANSGDTNQIFQLAGTTGLVIEDNALDGNAVLGPGGTGNISGSTDPNGPSVSDAVIRRNNMYNSEQGVRFILNRVSITENYFHDVGGVDADQIEMYPVGGTVDNIAIQYNYFTGPDNSQGGYNSAINMSTAAGLPAGTIGPHIAIDTKWFVDCPSVHTINNDTQGGGTLAFSFTNNGIYNTAGDYGVTTLFGSGSGTISPNSGNYVMATPTSRSGSLYVGTGHLE